MALCELYSQLQIDSAPMLPDWIARLGCARVNFNFSSRGDVRGAASLARPEPASARIRTSTASRISPLGRCHPQGVSASRGLAHRLPVLVHETRGTPGSVVSVDPCGAALDRTGSEPGRGHGEQGRNHEQEAAALRPRRPSRLGRAHDGVRRPPKFDERSTRIGYACCAGRSAAIPGESSPESGEP
jgi:hypothetical protein